MDRPPPTVDHAADRPVFKQVADDLRALIKTGRLKPGQALPAESKLVEDYGVGRNSIREALSALRSEGIIETVPRVGSRVRESPEIVTVAIGSQDRVRTRLATIDERRRHHIPEGVWVLEVTRADGQVELLAGDRTELQVGD